MKKRHLIACMLLVGALAGCGVEEPVKGPETDRPGTDMVYMDVAVQLPVGGGAHACSGTNSDTDDDYGTSAGGQEIGKDYENKVTNLLLVLADGTNRMIAYGEQNDLQEIKNGKISTTQKISKSTLSDFYNGRTLNDTERRVHVYTFCNPTSELKRIIEEAATDENQKSTWYDAVCTLSETANGTVVNGAVWGGDSHQDGFLMATASASRSMKTIPATFEDWNSYTSVDKAFNLSGLNNANSDKEIDNRGDIPVERAVARFDFRDGSGNNNTYDVIKSNEEEAKTIMQIQLQKMALVNMSKSFYYLRRVSDDGLNANAVICGTETSTNYVVDTDAAEKLSDDIIANGTYDKHFNFCLGHVNQKGEWGIDATARTQWYTSDIADVLAGNDDNDESWNPGATRGDYKIWRYVTENTIPGAIQRNGITTGIVFKGKMVATADASGTLADALNGVTGDSSADAILYAYSNNLYVTWVEVRRAALEAGAESEFYRAVFGNPQTVTPAAGDTPVYSDDTASADFKWNAWHNDALADDEALSAFKSAATAARFTLYQSSVDEDYGPGYYCYYFYWNRHNDNGNDGVMGPMEFAVVRNNVYKLAVTKIDRLGHPRITDNDPDPVDPEDPDEKGDLYLSVSVEVLPWVVRENDIEF